ncbi:MAG: TRAP transporter small permease [Actinomycetales bacterium]
MSTDESPGPKGADPRSAGGLSRVTGILWTAYAVIGGIGVLALLGTVVADVLLRYFAGAGIRGGSDLVSSWFMTTIAFTGIALMQRRGGLIQVDFIADAMPGRIRQVVDVLALLVTALVALLFAWFGLEQAIDQMEAGEYAPIGNRPIWPFRFMVPLGFAGFALACLLSVVDVVRRGPVEIPAAELEREITTRAGEREGSPT